MLNEFTDFDTISYLPLLRALVKALHDPDDLDELARFLSRSFPWEDLVLWLKRNRLVSLFYYVLRNSDLRLQIPEETWEHIRVSYFQSVLQYDKVEIRLGEVLKSFRAEGIQTVLLKGAVMAWSVYPAPAIRPMIDIDLLIPPEQWAKADQVLNSLGYSRLPHIDGHSQEFQEKFDTQIDYEDNNSSASIGLDVHWGFPSSWLFLRAFPLKALWESSQPFTREGLPAQQFSPEDMLIHLSFHIAAYHTFIFPALSLIDIDMVIQSTKQPLDWKLLLQRASQFKLRPHLYFTLLIAQEYLHTPVPPWVMKKIKPSSFRIWLVRRFLGSENSMIFDRSPRSKPADYFCRMLLTDQILDGFYTVKDIFCPGKEWLVQRYGLTRSSEVVLYSFLHPLLWFKMGISTIWQTISH